MKITALEEYGLRCMLQFAISDNGKPLTLPEVSTKEGLSIPYTGKLLMILKQAGLLKAMRGRNGGYVLARPATEMMLGEIFRVLGDRFYGPHHCRRYSGNSDACVHDQDCTVRNIWNTFDRFISGILNKVTLADLAAGNLNFVGALNPILDTRLPDRTIRGNRS
nr:Rrf2 family transcriptional regulator [candidate division Zixibacteria bacterium]